MHDNLRDQLEYILKRKYYLKNNNLLDTYNYHLVTYNHELSNCNKDHLLYDLNKNAKELSTPGIYIKERRRLEIEIYHKDDTNCSLHQCEALIKSSYPFEDGIMVN